MTAQSSAGWRRAPEATAVGLVMFLGVVGSARLALFSPPDAPGGSALSSASALATAALLLVAGIEALRIRHFALVLFAPVVPAILTIGFVIATGQLAWMHTVWVCAAMMAVTARHRAAYVPNAELTDREKTALAAVFFVVAVPAVTLASIGGGIPPVPALAIGVVTDAVFVRWLD